MVKVSVLIAVYNTEPYLRQCMDSVLNQTLKDIEIICVDDHSQDGSYDILLEYEKKDSRVKVFRFEENKKLVRVRKKGVLEAHGEYIMFLDADDRLEPEACRILYEKAKKEQVDILHFSSSVKNCGRLPESDVTKLKKVLSPYPGRLAGEAVFSACFVQGKYGYTLWNKIYRTQLCKTAFAQIEDRAILIGEDAYSYYIISQYAGSYMGWRCEPLYCYGFGRGVTGNPVINMEEFAPRCYQAEVITAMEDYDRQNGSLKKNAPVREAYRNQWLTGCVNQWRWGLPAEYGAEGWQLLCQCWGTEAVVDQAARMYWGSSEQIGKRLKNLPKLFLKGRTIKTIGMYYHCLTIGGVERVISILAPMFASMGYQVVVITDTEPSEQDYPLPSPIKRVTIPKWEDELPENVERRLKAWREIQQTYHPDVLLYHDWTQSTLIWDLLYLRGMNIPVIVHTHSVFSCHISRLKKDVSEFSKRISLADGVIVLSPADKVFWNAYNENVYYIPNPVSAELSQAKPARWENKTVIWVGRVSWEKQPEAVFDIVEHVAAQIPEVQLMLVGNFEDPKWKMLAKKKGIENNIRFCGATKDVYPYYEKASVFLSTSLFEGFSMTLLEAQAHGLPTVMFDLPNLTMGKTECGVLSVDMMDCVSAANQIVQLLTQREKWEKASAQAKSSYETIAGYDQRAVWQKVLRGEIVSERNAQAVNDMIHSFINHYEIGCDERDREWENSRYQGQEVAPVTSISYRVGCVITFVPRMIVGGIQCWKENGLRYTLRLIVSKVTKKLKRN